MSNESVYDKEIAQALKGVAIVMMLFFHCFREQSVYEGFAISFFPFRETSIVNIANTCKICVSLFAFITGYGLYLNYSNHCNSSGRWVLKRYVKTFSRFWFVWAISAFVFQIIDGRFSYTYGKGLNSVWYSAIDFFGFADLFKTPTLNANWWYMSAAIVFIVMMVPIHKYSNYLWLVIAGEVAFIRVISPQNAFTGHNSIYAFLSAYLLGCLFAKYDLFRKWSLIGLKSKWAKAYKLCVELWILVFLYKSYHSLPIEKIWEFHYGLFPIIVILICVEFIIPLLKRPLSFLGKHSMNIYLTHTFIRLYYLRDFTYSFKFFIIIICVLLCISLIISITIEWIKKATGYNALISRGILRRL